MRIKQTEQGNEARQALHDMRWGPHIEDLIERQEKMDNAIKVALEAITTLEAKLSKMEETLTKIAGAGEPLDGAAYHPADAVWMRTDAREALAGE